MALRRMVVSPIGKVVDAMRAVQDGNLDHEVNLKRSDELGLLADAYNFMVRGLRERARLADAFSRYVSSQVYAKFQSGEIQLSGELKDATVLFSDIRSFTSLSEQLSPGDVVAMLNEYFTAMVEIVFKYEGFVNKFIGDALMAIYNIPLTQSQPELRAVRTALEMLESLATLNAKREARGQFPLRIGIGINTGPVIAGNIGHQKRLEYTVIGDTVNVAQRIESQTKVTGTPLLIAEATYKAVAEFVEAEALPPVKVKGKQEAVVLYAVKGLRPGAPPAVAPRPTLTVRAELSGT
jgi:adenylate cyclase